MLRNIPVVFGEKQIGFFQSVCFDQARKRVRALIVSSGIQGKKTVYAQHIRMIADGFMLVDGLCRYRQTDRQQNSLFVRDATGLLAGRVTDYAIDRSTLEVLAVEVMPGYLPQENRRKVWMYEYSFIKEREELGIPVVLHSLPCSFREGNEACGCPP